MNILEWINKKIGFTKNELRVIIFLAAAFVIGAGIKIYKANTNEQPGRTFDYSESDAQFQSLSQNTYLSQGENIPINENAPPPSQQKKSLPKEKSINLNKADKTELMKLPGIGVTTADAIIKYREENNGFDDINQLLKVKGIGKKKLEKIAPYLTLEK
ncbi:MAG: helix-hairpin-helix domain-containing protein [Bacteroidota bacterium]|nr:helix-hairpin-helix domain-containing protein [Bacteroidota bacterium]